MIVSQRKILFVRVDISSVLVRLAFDRRDYVSRSNIFTRECMFLYHAFLCGSSGV